MHPLDDPRLKFGRAWQELQALNDEVQRFNQDKTCIMIPELNMQTGECLIRAKILKSPPLEWAIIIGEIAHNLRSCLDHLVWQLALSLNPHPYPLAEFPIFTDPAEYRKKGCSSIRDLSDPMKAFIEGLQPYHAGNAAHEQPLWLLHELNNTDKHRTLAIANVAIVYGSDPPGNFRFFFHGGDLGKAQEMKLKFTMNAQLGVPMDDNAVFAAFQILDMGLQREVQVEVEATSTIIFGKGLGVNSLRPVDRTLISVFKQVETILSDAAQFF